MPRPFRPHTRLPRTHEQIRQEAARHFQWLADRNGLSDLTAEQCQRAGELGPSLVDYVLGCEEEAYVDLDAWFAQHAPDKAEQILVVMNVLPFVSGSLTLLRMEFTHPVVGVVPPSVLRDMLSTGAPVTHEGQQLTPETVFVQYRRLTL